MWAKNIGILPYYHLPFSVLGYSRKQKYVYSDSDKAHDDKRPSPKNRQTSYDEILVI
jgi:hypothetical protein